MATEAAELVDTDDDTGITRGALEREVPNTFDSPRGLRKFGRYLLLAIVAFIVIFPIYTTIIALSLIHISEPTRRACRSRMPSSA